MGRKYIKTLMIFISTHGIMVDINFQLLISVLLCNIFILILEAVSMLKTAERSWNESWKSSRVEGRLDTGSRDRIWGGGHSRRSQHRAPRLLGTAGSIGLGGRVKITAEKAQSGWLEQLPMLLTGPGHPHSQSDFEITIWELWLNPPKFTSLKWPPT